MQSADTGSMFSWFGANDMISWIMFAVFTVITFAMVFILASRLKKNVKAGNIGELEVNLRKPSHKATVWFKPSSDVKAG